MVVDKVVGFKVAVGSRVEFDEAASMIQYWRYGTIASIVFCHRSARFPTQSVQSL